MSMRTGLLKTLDASLGPVLCAAFSGAQRAPETRTLRDFPGGRVLVVRPGGIGDAVLLLPALRALREAVPGSKVDVLCESRNAPVFELSGFANRILRADAAPFSTLRALRRGRYAAVLDTEQFHRFSAVLAARTQAPLRVGFNVAPARLGLYTHTVPYDLQGAEDTQFGRILAAALGVPSVSLAASGRVGAVQALGRGPLRRARRRPARPRRAPVRPRRREGGLRGRRHGRPLLRRPRPLRPAGPSHDRRRPRALRPPRRSRFGHRAPRRGRRRPRRRPLRTERPAQMGTTSRLRPHSPRATPLLALFDVRLYQTLPLLCLHDLHFRSFRS